MPHLPLFSCRRYAPLRLSVLGCLLLPAALRAQTPAQPDSARATAPALAPARPDTTPAPGPTQVVTRQPAEMWMIRQIKSVSEFVDRYNGQLPVSGAGVIDSASLPMNRQEGFVRLFDEDDARLRLKRGADPLGYAGRVAQFVEAAADPVHSFRLTRQPRLYAEVDYRVWIGRQPDTLRVCLAKFYTPDHVAYWQVIGVEKPRHLTVAAVRSVPIRPDKRTTALRKTTKPTTRPVLTNSVTTPAVSQSIAALNQPVRSDNGAAKSAAGTTSGPVATTTTPAAPVMPVASVTVVAARPAEADTTHRLKLPPNAHEVRFLPLLRGLIAEKSLLRFAPDTCRPDADWLAVEAALKTGRLTVETGQHTSVFVDTERGWVLKINDLNRDKDNSGWLITDLSDSDTSSRLPLAIRTTINFTKR